MAQKRKTPPAIAELILVKYPAQISYVEELIRVKTSVAPENQGRHVREGNPDQWIGRLEGYQCAMEDAMHKANCYAGFMYVGAERLTIHEDGTESKSRFSVGIDHPEFREWRRVYFTNGLASR